MKRASAIGVSGLGVVVLGLSLGCGSSSKGATTNNGAPDGGDTQQPGDDTAAVDAGGTTVDPHSIYPAPHPAFPKMHDSGGRVLGSPRIVTVTFQGMDSGLRDELRAFDDEITKTGYWDTIMDGYGVGEGRGDGSVELPDTFSNVNTDDGDIQKWLAQEITENVLPQPTQDTIYVLYMPSAATITLQGSQSCQSFGGYHFSADVTLDAKSQRFYYAVINECLSSFGGGTPQEVQDELTSTASHELAEAATDPDVDNGVGAYYMLGNDAWASSQRGGEVGDLCEGYSGVQTYYWSVATIWNQAAADKSLAPCQPSGPVYYGAIPHTVVPGQRYGGAPTADGYVTAEIGKTTDIEVDVFSTAPLDKPFTVVAGRSRGGSDPTVLNPLKGVTMTLSQPTATNGDKITLSITPTAAATHKSTLKFVVRSVLSAKDYHSWPVLLYIP